MFRTRWITVQDSGFRAGVASSGYAHDWAELTQDSGFRVAFRVRSCAWSHVHSGFRIQGWPYGYMAIQGSGLRVGPKLWLYTIQIYGSGFRVRVAQGWGRTLRATPKDLKTLDRNKIGFFN